MTDNARTEHQDQSDGLACAQKRAVASNDGWKIEVAVYTADGKPLVHKSALEAAMQLLTLHAITADPLAPYEDRYMRLSRQILASKP